LASRYGSQALAPVTTVESVPRWPVLKIVRRRQERTISVLDATSVGRF